MKLSGGKRNGQHLEKHSGKSYKNGASANLQNSSKKSGKKHTRSRGQKLLRFLTVFFVVIIAIISVVFAYYKLAVDKPPPVKEIPRSNVNRQTGTETEEPAETTDVPEPVGDRIPGRYTLLVMGTDDGNWNTDTIMIVSFDSVNYTVDVVNIPRDTAVNVSWSTKRINSILANEKVYFNKDKNLTAKERTAKAFDGTIEKFADVLGFEVDYYVLVDMDAFVKLVNAIDGVDFDIPVNMNYEDPAQDLYIHYTKGVHHLTGKQALEVVRFRSYAQGDIKRVSTQQDFLKSAAEQILAKKNSINITTLADIFINHIETDLQLSEIMWFGKELLKLDPQNINFDKLPGNYTDSVNGQSYVTVYVDEWLEMVNAKLNPFYAPVERNDVSILYRGTDGKIYVTDGNYAYSNTSWGTRSSSSSSGSSSNNSSSDSPGSSAGGGNEETPAPSDSPPENEALPEIPIEGDPAEIDVTPGGGDSPEDDTTPDGTPDSTDETTPADNENDDDDYPTQLGPPPETTPSSEPEPTEHTGEEPGTNGEPE